MNQYLLLFTFVTFCFGAAEETNGFTLYTDDSEGIESLITNQALASFKSKYKEASQNKAFAQSLSGAWSWKSNRTSVEHAKTSALIGCQRNNKKTEDLYPCKVVNINGTWVR